MPGKSAKVADTHKQSNLMAKTENRSNLHVNCQFLLHLENKWNILFQCLILLLSSVFYRMYLRFFILEILKFMSSFLCQIFCFYSHNILNSCVSKGLSRNEDFFSIAKETLVLGCFNTWLERIMRVCQLPNLLLQLVVLLVIFRSKISYKNLWGFEKEPKSDVW